MMSIFFSMATVIAVFSHIGSTMPAPAPVPIPLPNDVDALAALGITYVGPIVEDVNITKRAGYGTFTAYYGSHCDSGAGGAASITNAQSCIKTSDRHSFSVSGCSMHVSADTSGDPFSSNNCADRYAGNASPGCYNVNTGQFWGSSLVYCIN